MRAPEMMFLEASRVDKLGKLPLTPHSTGSWPVRPVFVSRSVCTSAIQFQTSMPVQARLFLQACRPSCPPSKMMYFIPGQ